VQEGRELISLSSDLKEYFPKEQEKWDDNYFNNIRYG